MTTPPPALGPAVDTGSAVELLERALAYTCGALATVAPAHLDRPTPCRAWLLRDLLAHMEDCLDAFTEGAAGSVDSRPGVPSGEADVLAALRVKAHRLLGAWTLVCSPLSTGARTVSFGTHALPQSDVAALAAVEIAVHGWDVATSTAADVPMPPALATDLEPWARWLVVNDLQADSVGQPRLFAPPRPGSATADPVRRLVGLLGRPT
ncbi:TIGR03086 family metal-binding protein [Nocardioides sambongensis]|uniref:TIGR03086 family metal-binding protein n=1 Tax=Nocardioides sambongensis TaxID=2589074 RepID=UPI00112D3853|nr:TIGR03086 family metal-binding protein [Nocardioides sambongensis]